MELSTAIPEINGKMNASTENRENAYNSTLNGKKWNDCYKPRVETNDKSIKTFHRCSKNITQFRLIKLPCSQYLIGYAKKCAAIHFHDGHTQKRRRNQKREMRRKNLPFPFSPSRYHTISSEAVGKERMEGGTIYTLNGIPSNPSFNHKSHYALFSFSDDYHSSKSE